VIKSYLFIFIICVVFFLLGTLHLSESFQFGSDQGRDFLKVWQMVQDKKPLFIGPPSEYTISGREFFFGPAPYYIILPALLIGNWEPLTVGYWLVTLNAIILFISLVILDRNTSNRFVIYCFAILYAFTPLAISDAQSFWNPYFMLPVSLLLLALLVRSKHTSAKELFLSIGFLFGLGLQFHFSFVFAILIALVWLAVHSKLAPKSVSVLISGFIIGFLPLIIFDLRNQFYNLSTFIAVFTNHAGPLAGFTFNSFYLLSLIPFIIFGISQVFTHLHKALPRFTYSLLGIYILWTLFFSLPAPKQDLSYSQLQKLTAVIKTDKPKNYNIVDQISNDNRAMALRYFLTVQGFPPEAVDKYPNAETLYIYSKLPLETLLKNPIWEIRSFLPYEEISTKQVDRDMYLYILNKN
jgi:hypothetical protein